MINEIKDVKCSNCESEKTEIVNKNNDENRKLFNEGYDIHVVCVDCGYQMLVNKRNIHLYK